MNYSLLTRLENDQSSVKNVFIRGSVVRYVHLQASSVDVTLLEDATRRGKPSTQDTKFLEAPFLTISLEAQSQQAKAK